MNNPSENQEMFKKELDKHFKFLETEFGFRKIPEYQFVREIHNDFIKDDIIIKLAYEGSFWIEILKTKNIETELVKNEKHTVDFNYNSFKRYNLQDLDSSRKIYNSVSSDNFPDKDLWYFAKLLKDNSEILKGDLSILTSKHKYLKMLGLKKQTKNR